MLVSAPITITVCWQVTTSQHFYYLWGAIIYPCGSVSEATIMMIIEKTQIVLRKYGIEKVQNADIQFVH
jgi:hypothetical protein